MLFVVLLLAGCAIYCLAVAIMPLIEKKRQNWHEKQTQILEKELDKVFSYQKGTKQIMLLYYILPLGFSLAAWLIFNSSLFIIIGAIVGAVIPNFILKIRESSRRQKLNSQLLDVIMTLSSSLKGGLSLLQGLEVIVEEMPPPISQELGLVVRENRMGINLDDSLKSLSKRMNLDELNLFVNSMLVARETGGDLTKVLSRLVVTIRDNRKLRDNINTLTLQGRMQGIIMSLLPIFFTWWIMTTQPHHFDIMLNDQKMGRPLLMAAVFLQLVGMILIKKFSTVKI